MTEYGIHFQVSSGPDPRALPPRPSIHLDSSQREIADFESHWDSAGGKSHHNLVRWLYAVREAMAIELPAPRSVAVIRLMSVITGVMYQSSLIGREGALPYYWGKICQDLLDSVSDELARVIEDVHRTCWGSLDHAEDFQTIRDAVERITPLRVEWSQCTYGAAADKTKLILKYWNNAAKCLDAYEIDKECLSIVQNTKGRVTQRKAAERMVKKLTPLDVTPLPRLMDMWANQRLDYWKTQLLLVSLPEDKPSKPKSKKAKTANLLSPPTPPAG